MYKNDLILVINYCLYQTDRKIRQSHEFNIVFVIIWLVYIKTGIFYFLFLKQKIQILLEIRKLQIAKLINYSLKLFPLFFYLGLSEFKIDENANILLE